MDRMKEEKYLSRSTSIISTLKSRILGWEYPLEYRLTEEVLCKEFGVSRSPVREALRELATHGFLKQMPHRGYAIKQLSPQKILEIYDVRMALELFVVEQLAQREEPIKEIEDLKQTWTALLNEPPPKVEELAEFDTKFHETLAQALGNVTLLEELRVINERLLVFRMSDFGRPERTEVTCHHHLKILARIEAKDMAGACKAMRENIEDGRNYVSLAIKEVLAKNYFLKHSSPGAL
jgi:DNA-binding GntR family transcriptional regulator